MANWFYYNKSGEKVGPIKPNMLKTLTQQGVILRKTVLENHTRRTAIAGEVNGLEFPTLLDTKAKTTVAPPESDEVYGVTSPSVVEKPAVVNPFTVSVPVTEKPVPSVVEKPVVVNPFTASAPAPAPVNPFTVAKPQANQTTPQPVPQSMPVPVTKKSMFASKRAKVIGVIVGILLLYLVGHVTVVTMMDNARMYAEFDKLLAERGGDINAVDQFGNTLLHKAVDQDFWSGRLVTLALSKGANVNVEGGTLGTPLHAAAFYDKVEVVKILVDAGAEVNAKKTFAETPLHSVAGNRSRGADVAKILVAAGADVSAKDMFGKTPLDVARERKNTAVAEYLESVANQYQPTPTSVNPSLDRMTREAQRESDAYWREAERKRQEQENRRRQLGY